MTTLSPPSTKGSREVGNILGGKPFRLEGPDLCEGGETKYNGE